uniref:HAT C-terminal dimerisation domain-containing protein n=1 Tax=Denticeps clupeoides TaxID=299321 RepID=A0AAY4AZD2_9TELE
MFVVNLQIKTGGAAAVQQPTVAESFAKCVTYAPRSKQAEDLNKAVVYFIAKDMMPFQIVEKPGFLHLMKKAVPQYKVPTRNYFSTTKLPAMYQEVRAGVEEQLAEGEWFGATTDLWTSTGGGGEPFILSLTALILFIFQKTTAEHITEMMENMLIDWKIKKETLSGITTDNASNMRKAFESFPCVWFSCFGHNLNLVLKMPRVESAIRACRHLVQRKCELQKKQAQLNIPLHSLIHDVVTRWGSTFEMISRFLEQQQAICGVLAEDRSTWHFMPKDNEITVLEEVSQLLCPLHDFIDVLASEKQVTLSSVKPVLEHRNNEILQEKGEDSTLTKQMKHVMKQDIMQLRYTEEMKNVLNICSFVDPRFRENFVENLDETVKSCTDEAMAHASHLESEQPPAATTESTSSNTNTTTKRKEKSLSGLLQQITAKKNMSKASGSAVTVPSIQERIDSEVKLYLSLPTVSADSDPLAWWKAHVEEIPMLLKVCIPATSVPSERVFSSSGHILSPDKRGRMSDRVLEEQRERTKAIEEEQMAAQNSELERLRAQKEVKAARARLEAYDRSLSKA